MKALFITLCCCTLTAAAQLPIDSLSHHQAHIALSKMTLKNKLYEMHGHGIARFGMSMVFAKKLKQIVAGGNKKLGIPGTVFNDGPRGLFHYKGATAFPVTMARGASWDIDLEKRIGEAMAKEIIAAGGNYSGAVCMNLLRHPAWGRAQETYGEDPWHIGEMAVALVKGIQQHGVQACVKHFAANSMENNRFGGSMNMSERTLHEVYLPHFKKTIDSGAASVMSAYNKLNGEYCGHNKYLLTDVLRHQWGFKGYVTSDWSYGLCEAKKGIEAGMNVEMPTGKVYKYKTIRKLLRNGTISIQQVDDLVRPILYTKFYFSNLPKKTFNKSVLGCAEHIALAQEAAEKSAVLLKNENQLLPLSKNIKCVAVIGSLATVQQTGDRGSSSVTPAYIISAYDGLKKYLTPLGTEVLTCAINDTSAIRQLCSKADVVIVVAGTTHQDEGEYIGNFTIRDRNNPGKKNFVVKAGILGLGGDRKYLHLHEPDIKAIQTAASINKNVVVSLVAGSAVTVEEWHDKVPAILQTFYNGMKGGTALARLLFGDVSPGGKLPFTVPKNESDLPSFDSYADTVHYGYYHGYTLFEKEQKQPRFPFGFGLSYSSFSISQLKVNSTPNYIEVNVNVKNTGTAKAAEVLQAYVSFPAIEVDMPNKLLRGFDKVELQPGEEKQITLHIPLSALQYYDELSHSWMPTRGTYTVWVGNSSADPNMLSATFTR